VRRVIADEARASDAVASVVDRIRAVYGRWRRDTPVAQMRADWDALFAGPVDAVVESVIAGDAPGVPCEWVAAPGARSDRAVAYLHGGGFRVGSPASHRALMARLSAACGARVLGVGYRLAPEHRYPAALQDTLAVLDWLPRIGLGAGQVALAGDSAGAGLALAAMLALQADGRAAPAGAYLMSAWTDLGASGASYETRAASDPIHDRRMILAMAQGYLPAGADPRDPLVSPLHATDAQLAALPPLLMQVGDRETVLSDTLDFAARARAAGVPVQCQVWPGMIHVFQQFPDALGEADAALAAGGAFLAARLGCDINRDRAT
jgi:acetyl esterase/lipase